jgi:hypothetical protein
MPVLGGAVAASSTPGVINVLDYGAVGNLAPSSLAGSTDDSAAIQAAANALGGTNRTLYFPRTTGDYRCDTPPTFPTKQGITILGPYGSRPASNWYVNGNPTGGALVYTGGFASRSDARLLDLRDSHAVTVRGMVVRSWASSTLTQLIDTQGTGSSPTYGFLLENSWADTNGSVPNLRMLELQGAVTAVVRNCQFGAGGAKVAISGAPTSGGALNWANAVTVEDVMVYQMPSLAAIHNPGMGWSFRMLTLEPPPSASAYGVLHDRAGFGEAVSFDGCGFWDVGGSGAISLIKSTGNARGWSFDGCLFDLPTNISVPFDFTGANGISVTGCRFKNPTAGGTPVIFKAGQNITSGNFAGNYVESGITDNHAAVFV